MEWRRLLDGQLVGEIDGGVVLVSFGQTGKAACKVNTYARVDTRNCFDLVDVNGEARLLSLSCPADVVY